MESGMLRHILASIFICTIIFFITACSSYQVKIDADPDSEFERYETFGWLNTSKKIDAFNRIDNNRLTDLVHNAVDRIMTAKGYEKLMQGDPDLVLTFYAGLKGPIEVDDEGYTYGKWFDRGEAVEQEGVLIVDLIDNERRVLIQRARGGTIVDDPEKAAELIAEMIQNMFADVPERSYQAD